MKPQELIKLLAELSNLAGSVSIVSIDFDKRIVLYRYSPYYTDLANDSTKILSKSFSDLR